MNGWKKLILKDIVEGFFDGPHATPKESETGAIFLGIKNITEDGRIDLTEIRHISMEEMPKWTKRVYPSEGDIVFSYEATLHRYAMIPKDFIGCLGRRMALIRVNEKVANKYFLFKYMFSANWKKEVERNILTGATVDRIPLTKVPEFELILPPLPTQNRIASILSTYDDLIENNLKRIKLLEEIAQRTYEEWFVKFRVNGEQLTMDEKNLLPLGWERISVKEYADEIAKGPSLNYDFDGNKYPVLNQSCVRNGEIELDKVLYAQELPSNKEKYYLRINDIVINSMGQGTLGRVSKNVSIKDRFIIHNCITFVRAKETLSQYQLFYFLSSKQSYFEGVAQGSTGQTTLKVNLIEELEIQFAPKDIITHFNFIIKPLWEQMGVLKNQNQRLKESRDILLPKLMNGIINVE